MWKPGRRGTSLSAGRVRRNSSSVSTSGVVSQRESRTRAVKASREVVCPILRGGAARRHPHRRHFHTPPRQDRRRAPLRFSCATPSVRGHPRSGPAPFSRILTNIISPLWAKLFGNKRKRTQNISISFAESFVHMRKLDYRLVHNATIF